MPMSNLHPTLEASCIRVAAISVLVFVLSIVFDNIFNNHI